MVEGLLYRIRLSSVTGMCRSGRSSMTVVVASAAITAAVAVAARQYCLLFMK